jgi:RIO kinase 1
MSSRDKFKIYGNVFDAYTINNLNKLSARQLFHELKSALSMGKEANIFTASTDNAHIIVKIYRLGSCNFNKMFDYLKQDSRMTGIKKQKRKIVFAWTKREYRNLMKARDLGIHVPTPIEVLDNILLLEFLGEGDDAAPQLKDMNFSQMTKKKIHEIYNKIVVQMRMLHKGGLVHGDLSGFNILYHNNQPYFIDFSQATVSTNYQYRELLERDVKNIVTLFKRHIDVNEDDLLATILEK